MAVDLREVWHHEELEFTPWLEENIEVLSDVLGAKLSEVERERFVGPFQADLTAVDERGAIVIIENQLGSTDHDHLGKLLTYLSNLDAKTAVWIVRDPRPEHQRAVEWLNDSTPADVRVYLLKLAAYRIGNSPPAPQLSVVAGPTSAGKAVSAFKQTVAHGEEIHREFWTSLLERA